jgi:hypothetical protein
MVKKMNTLPYALVAMNTIPTTFNENLPAYTAVSGGARGGHSGLSAILLNRGGRYPRRALFEELEKEGFDSVISVERPEERYDIEELSLAFPFVRFILLKTPVNTGYQINLAAAETESPLFFVLWNDLHIIHGGGAGRITELLLKDGNIKRLCTVPMLQNMEFETIPTIIAPFITKKSADTLLSAPMKEEAPSLFPFDGVGIYDRERFIRLGGFDGGLQSPYWQLMDFGFRAWLRGELINCTQFVRLTLEGAPAPHDATVDESYRRFHLKNLSPVVRSGSTGAHLPLRRFPAFLLRGGLSPLAAWKEFSAARRWVSEQRYNFQRDASQIMKIWENEALPPLD